MHTISGVALAFSTLFSCVAHAGDHERREWNPPARFDHPFPGTLVEEPLPRDQVLKLCPKLLSQFKIPGEVTRGCSILLKPDLCLIVYIDKPYHGTEPAAVKRHEVGHCDGWPADHPN